jgi:hypothetical protein
MIARNICRRYRSHILGSAQAFAKMNRRLASGDYLTENKRIEN